MRSFTFRGLVSTAMMACGAVPTLAQPLIGVHFDSGNLYNIEASDASIGLLGGTGISGIGALELNPVDGFYYAVTTGSTASLYRLEISANLDTIESIALVGPLGVNSFEGGLAFSLAPDGTAYAFNQGFNIPALYTIDLATGEASTVGVLDERHDINGLAWRSDGMLIGLDATEQELVLIDPATAALTTLAELTPIPGGVGGMTLLGANGYFVTAGPGSIIPGSNELWRFDPFTGEHFLVGDFDEVISGAGLSGLTIVPEPATLSLLLMGCASGILRCRKPRIRTEPV